MRRHEINFFRANDRSKRIDNAMIAIACVGVVLAVSGVIATLQYWFSAWTFALFIPIVLCGVEILLEATHVTTRMSKPQVRLYVEYRRMSADSRRKIPRLNVDEIYLMGSDECDQLAEKLQVIRELEETNRATRIKVESWYPRIVELTDLRGRELRQEHDKLTGKGEERVTDED